MIRVDGITIDRKRRTIERDGATCALTRLQFRLACHLLLAGPKDQTSLLHAAYGDQVDGGPLYARVSFSLIIDRLRGRLLDIGIEIHSDPPKRGAHNKRYWAAPWSLPQQEAAE